MKNKFSFSAPAIATFLVLGITALPVLATGPAGTPISGNVDPKFSSLSVGTAGTTGFYADSAGILSNPTGVLPVTINDDDGLLVITGGGKFGVTNGSNVSNDGWISVGKDADVGGDATAYNVNAWDTVKAPYIVGTYHVKGLEVGAYTTAKFLYSTINAGTARDYPSNLPSTYLTCPNGSIAVACNYEAFSDVASCGGGYPSVQSNNVVATKIMLEPQGGGYGAPKSGGYCNATLKNTGATQICGLVSVECWNPNG